MRARSYVLVLWRLRAKSCFCPVGIVYNIRGDNGWLSVVVALAAKTIKNRHGAIIQAKRFRHITLRES